MQPNEIYIRGAKEHNLQNIDVTLPRFKFIVITGVSGSGKSSLALDTLYAEGQRRYVESLSSYARQFIGQMEKPKVDHITGLSPAIAIEQNLDVIKTADWIVDLGPEGGDKGGYIVAEGSPEEVAQVESSYTGRFLQKMLDKFASNQPQKALV